MLAYCRAQPSDLSFRLLAPTTGWTGLGLDFQETCFPHNWNEPFQLTPELSLQIWIFASELPELAQVLISKYPTQLKWAVSVYSRAQPPHLSFSGKSCQNRPRAWFQEKCLPLNSNELFQFTPWLSLQKSVLPSWAFDPLKPPEHTYASFFFINAHLFNWNHCVFSLLKNKAVDN